MKSISFNNFREMRNYLLDFNKENYGKKVLNYCYILFSKNSFDKEYSIAERTYTFSSDNKIFRHNIISNSLFADCMDGKDRGVRLDWYMEELGNKDGWKIQECFICIEE